MKLRAAALGLALLLALTGCGGGESDAALASADPCEVDTSSEAGVEKRRAMNAMLEDFDDLDDLQRTLDGLRCADLAEGLRERAERLRPDRESVSRVCAVIADASFTTADALVDAVLEQANQEGIDPAAMIAAMQQQCPEAVDLIADVIDAARNQ